MEITKELFVESIKAIKKQYKHDAKCSKAFGVILPDSDVTYYNNDYLLDQMLKILNIATNDESNWIEYYIYDLEFGKSYYEGSVLIDDGHKIFELKTASDLWNLLNIS